MKTVALVSLLSSLASLATSTTTTLVTSTSTAPAAGQTLLGQCGGMGYAGPTRCAVGTCTVYNPYYAQCVPTQGTW